MAHEGVDLIDTASLNQLDLVFVPAIPHRKFVLRDGWLGNRDGAVLLCRPQMQSGLCGTLCH